MPGESPMANRSYLMTIYCSSRATSALSTYLPISRRNCSMEVYGRYSLNSRNIRGPTPGMARICASVAVLILIGTMAVVLLAVLLVAGVVDEDGGGAGSGAIKVLLAAVAVSCVVSDLGVHATT